MLENRRYGEKIAWDQHLLVVYGVLVGLSLDQSFNLFASTKDKTAGLILLAGVIFIIVDKWIYLSQYFKVIDIDSKEEVGFYTLALIVDSCIFALYLAKSDGGSLSAPIWIMINLCIICVFDAITKYISIKKIISKFKDSDVPQREKELIGRFGFICASAIIYAFAYALIIYITFTNNFNVLQQSAIIILSWLVIRIIDYFASRRVNGFFASVYCKN
jgi:hypothetical protein